jgi:hypothetical protein
MAFRYHIPSEKPTERPRQHDGSRRSWAGFRRVVKHDDRLAAFRLLDGFQLGLADAERPVGLDLLSRNGSIAIMRK